MDYENVLTIGPHRNFTSEGYLICTGCAVARTGGRKYLAQEIPQVKPDDAGEVMVFRDSAVLFDKGAIASLEGKPVTLGHPPDDLSPANIKDYAVGTVTHVRPGDGEQGDSLVADLILYDKKAIQDVLDGKAQQLSLGYRSQVTDQGGGIGIESSIQANHLAIVPKGRCGEFCRINDSKKEGRDMAETKTTNEGKKQDADLSEAIKGMAAQIEALGKRLAALEDKAKSKEPEDEEKVDSKRDAKDETKKDAAPDLKAQIQAAVDTAVKQALKTEKASQAVIRDAAIVAPNLNSATANLATEALKEYAKDAANAKTLDAWGGIAKITDAEAPAILRALAGLINAQKAQAESQGRKQDNAPEVKGFFEQAKDLWKKGE